MDGPQQNIGTSGACQGKRQSRSLLQGAATWRI